MKKYNGGRNGTKREREDGMNRCIRCGADLEIYIDGDFVNVVTGETAYQQVQVKYCYNCGLEIPIQTVTTS